MDITIGVRQVARELSFETQMTEEEVSAAVEKALGGGTLELTDARGRRVIVPGEALGFIEMGEATPRRVGFANP